MKANKTKNCSLDTREYAQTRISNTAPYGHFLLVSQNHIQRVCVCVTLFLLTLSCRAARHLFWACVRTMDGLFICGFPQPLETIRDFLETIMGFLHPPWFWWILLQKKLSKLSWNGSMKGKHCCKPNGSSTNRAHEVQWTAAAHNRKAVTGTFFYLKFWCAA